MGFLEERVENNQWNRITHGRQVLESTVEGRAPESTVGGPVPESTVEGPVPESTAYLAINREGEEEAPVIMPQPTLVKEAVGDPAELIGVPHLMPQEGLEGCHSNEILCQTMRYIILQYLHQHPHIRPSSHVQQEEEEEVVGIHQATGLRHRQEQCDQMIERNKTFEK